MKRFFTIIMLLCLSVFVTACSQRSDVKSESGSIEPSVSGSISEPIQSSINESLSQSDEDTSNNEKPENNGRYDSTALIASLQDIIQQYKDGTVDTETGASGASAPDFSKKPDDLIFPDIKSESDLQSMEPIKGFEETLIVKIKCSGDYLMQAWVDTADDYKVTSVMFFG